MKQQEKKHLVGSYSFHSHKLWLYNGTRTVDTSRLPDGMHYFDSVGSGAGWDLGTNCDSGTDPTTRKCDSYTARWRGKSPIADKLDDDAVDWLLVAKDEDIMPPMLLAGVGDTSNTMDTYNEFWNYNWMQRLSTVGGLADSVGETCTGEQDLNKTVSSPYHCDYVLAFTPISIPSPDTSENDSVDIPSNCFQAIPMFGDGVQEYQFWDGEWILSQPKATLRAYSTTNQSSQELSLISGPQGLIGIHYFANVGINGTLGSGAGWVVGGNCSAGDSCLNLAGQLRGTLNASSSNGDDNFKVLLIQKDAENTPNVRSNFLNQYAWMQRLTTVGGIPPPATNGSQGEIFSSAYTSDYVLALCVHQHENIGNDDSGNDNEISDTSAASDDSNVLLLKLIVSCSLFVMSFCI